MLRTTRVLPVCVAVLVTAILFIGAGEVFASESTIRVTQIAAADAPMPAASASAPVASTAPHSDSGNMSWVLTSTVLVLMMGFPGIALFYSGLSRSKNSVNAFMQILAAVSIGSIAFVFVGFGVAFLPGNHFFGSLAPPSTWVTLNAPIGPMFPSVPAGLFGIFQVAFAAVTISIVLGASIERIRFPFVLLFVPLWVILVYSPVARWLWSDQGWLHGFGALDFAGGMVVHICSGFSALALALVLGKRSGFGHSAYEPSSPALVALGAAFLIIGWYGFNAGSALAADGSAVRALINTHVAACGGVAAWMVIEMILRRFTTMIGVLTGAIGALVAITPASGYVGTEAALLIGALGAGAAFFGAVLLRRAGMFDDSLDVFGVHGVAGCVGSVMVGVLAAPEVAPNASLSAQLAATGIVAVFSFTVTLLLAYVLNLLVRARVSNKEEAEGLDSTYHGEAA